MARANAVRGSTARITVRYEGDGHSTGTIRHPADEDSAAAAALRVPTKATSPAPAVSSGAAAVSSFTPSPSNVAPSHAANSRTRIGRFLRGTGYKSQPVFNKPLSNRACSFPAHGLPMIFFGWLAPGISRSLAADTDPSLQNDHGTTSPLDPPAARPAAPSSALAVHTRSCPVD